MKYKDDMERDKEILGEQMVEKIKMIQILEARNNKQADSIELLNTKIRELESELHKMKYDVETQVY
jgi:uncharacterized coiled-coil protein SlyX